MLSDDAPKATAHLKAMTNKMAESKRLIKEFEKAAAVDESMDPSAAAARKKDMVVQLNRHGALLALVHFSVVLEFFH